MVKSRRKKKVRIAVFLAISFFTILVFIFWPVDKITYIPGGEVEGLTSELSRSLPQDIPNVKFSDVTEFAGIKFQHFNGTRSVQLPEDMGSGAAWGDYDNDGWEDLYIANEAGPLTLTKEEVALSPAHSALYRNNGDGTFTEKSKEAGVDLRSLAMAPAWSDFNNDGNLDLVVTSNGKNTLFSNNGDGTFSDVSASSGISAYHGFWVGASWGDFNKDGYSDLYVCGYVKYVHQDNTKNSVQYKTKVPASINPSTFKPERNLLFKNNGDGTFSEIADKAGVMDMNGRSLASSWCDFDEDGWPDLYVANDVSDNAMFRNNGDGTFEEIGRSSFVADYRGAMGIGIGDWDNDTDMDMFITHWIAQENALYSNLLYQTKQRSPTEISARFMDEADRFGLGQIALDYIGFGTSFIDYDNSGYLDLFIVNGSTFQNTENPQFLLPMQDQIFWNKGPDKGFFDVSLESGEYFNNKYIGRGYAHADYDHDGDLDICIVNNGEPAILLRNDGGNSNNWITLTLHGVQSNPEGIGAKVRVVAGQLQQVRQIGAQGSYCSQNSMSELFGLGSHSAVDTVEIIWPSGLYEWITHLPVNQRIDLVEGENLPKE